MGQMVWVGFLCAVAWMTIIHGGRASAELWRIPQARRYIRHVHQKDLDSLEVQKTLRKEEKDVYRMLLQRKGVDAPRYRDILHRFGKERSKYFILYIGAMWLVLTATDEDFGRAGENVSGGDVTVYVVVGTLLILGIFHLTNLMDVVFQRCLDRNYEKKDKTMKTFLDPQMRIDMNPIAFEELLSSEEWRWAVRFADARGMVSLDSNKPGIYPPYFTRSGAYFLQFVDLKAQWEAFLGLSGENLPSWFDRDLTKPTPSMLSEMTEEDCLLYEMRKTFEEEVERRLNMVELVNASGKGIDAMLTKPFDVHGRFFSER